MSARREGRSPLLWLLTAMLALRRRMTIKTITKGERRSNQHTTVAAGCAAPKHTTRLAVWGARRHGL